MKKYFTSFVVAIVIITAFTGCAEYYYPQRHYEYHEGRHRSSHEGDRDNHRGGGDRDDRRRDRDDH